MPAPFGKLPVLYARPSSITPRELRIAQFHMLYRPAVEELTTFFYADSRDAARIMAHIEGMFEKAGLGLVRDLNDWPEITDHLGPVSHMRKVPLRLEKRHDIAKGALLCKALCDALLLSEKNPDLYRPLSRYYVDKEIAWARHFLKKPVP